MAKNTEIVVHEPSKILTARTPASAIYERPGPRYMRLRYVPWSWVAGRMNKAFGSKWSFRFLGDPQMQEQEILVKVEVRTEDGVQEAYGSHKYQKNNPNASYGDAVQSAASKALRRACSRWGVGLDMYNDIGDDIDPAVAEMKPAILESAKKMGVSAAELETKVEKLVASGKTEFEAWVEIAS